MRIFRIAGRSALLAVAALVLPLLASTTNAGGPSPATWVEHGYTPRPTGLPLPIQGSAGSP